MNPGVGAAAGVWSTPSNWSPDAIPGVTSIATFANGGDGALTDLGVPLSTTSRVDAGTGDELTAFGGAASASLG